MANGRLVNPKGKVNRTNRWVIPKIEVKPTRDYGEVTDGRKASLKASAKMKRERLQDPQEQARLVYVNMTNDERIAARIAARK